MDDLPSGIRENFPEMQKTDTALFPHYKDALASEVATFRESVGYCMETLTDDEAWIVSPFGP
jgi:hypothetical protein